MTRIICGALAALPLLAAGDDGTLKLTAELSSEARWYVQDAAWPGQSADEIGVSFSLLPELYYAWNRDTSVTVRPFARWDSIEM